MKILKTSINQQSFFISEFCLNKKEMPENFFSKGDLIDMIIGKSHIRLKDYEGNSEDFSDGCYLCITASGRDYYNFYRVAKQLEYIYKESVKKEYFELSNNLFIILTIMVENLEADADQKRQSLVDELLEIRKEVF